MKGTAKFFFILNILILIANWGFVIYNYFSLPEIVPTHFGVSGEVDGFGDKKMYFILLGIATALFVLMNYLSQNPYAPGLNIPDKMRENKDLTALFVQVLNFFCMVLFANISYESFSVALEKQQDLSLFTPIWLGLMFVVMFAFIIYANKQKTND